ncbi:MAG: hypothetical protein E7043_02610 [Lentisphaerae bacterium]|nr:hypothetical protein [Lentisphaerota bacterium]
MRIAAALLLGAVIAGCMNPQRAVPNPEVTLELLQTRTLQRHLSGEVNARLTEYAGRIGRASQWARLPDLARFVREAEPERGAELCREMLWECMLACNVQFAADPERMVRDFCAGQLRSRVAILLAEKQYFYPIAWKTAEQLKRAGEAERELEQLCGGISSLEAGKIILPEPRPVKTVPAAVTEDPAEPLQIAGVICLMPDEIRRQQLADKGFECSGLIREIELITARYASEISGKQLNAAEKLYRNDPSAENRLRFQKWHALYQLDISRLPASGGSARDRQFVKSMLLLQEGF